jgi:hypothetical protein
MGCSVIQTPLSVFLLWITTNEMYEAASEWLCGPRLGTALLFNISRLHTVCVRQTTIERKSLQAYYGHAHRHRAPEVSPWAVESLSAHLHRHVFNHSYDRIYI